MSLRELARVVQTSEVTVRRDVRALEAEGLLDRRHGGAVLPGGFTRESGFPQKSHLATAEKTAIADLAAGLVEEGEAIVVGAGTTTQELARRLARVPGLTVVTNSLLVAQALAHANRVEVVMTGGTLRGSNYALVGSGADVENHSHIQECEICRELYEQLQTIAQAAKQLFPDQEPEDKLWERIESAIKDEDGVSNQD